MKRLLTTIGKILIFICWFMLTGIVIGLFGVTTLIFGIFEAFKEGFDYPFVKNTDRKVDVFGNETYADFWNWLFGKNKRWSEVGKCYVTDGVYKFGRENETLSSCIGRRFEQKSLNLAGYFVYYFLFAVCFLSWFEGGHCRYSIQSEEELKNNNIEVENFHIN